MKKSIFEALKESILVSDGAMGTMLQKIGFDADIPPDYLCIKDPDKVKKVHRGYLNAGAVLIITNTFGANRFKLSNYSLENQVSKINHAAVKLAREAVQDKAFLLGDIGSLGKMLIPLGEISFDQAFEAFREQALALEQAGVDGFIIETISEILELKAAIIAVRSISDKLLISSMTFDTNGRSLSGTDPRSYAITAEASGADIIGANCGMGPDAMEGIVLELRGATSLPIMAQPNAGLPILDQNGETVWQMDAPQFAEITARLVEKGANIVGGCCGTTWEHIRELSERVKHLGPIYLEHYPLLNVTSRTKSHSIGKGLPFTIIGERINATGRKKLSEEILEYRMDMVRQEGIAQANAGAHLLDVNMGVPGIDEPKAMTKAVLALSGAVDLPLAIDSIAPDTLEAALKVYPGRPLINSISAENKKLVQLLPLAKKYGAAFIGLTIDDRGLPDSAQDRLNKAQTIIEAAKEYGLDHTDIMIDPVVLTVGSSQRQAMETLKAVELINQHLGIATSLGISNISFGLPNRGLITRTFASMALAYGLAAGIVNPLDGELMDILLAAQVLSGIDHKAQRYIKAYSVKGTKQLEMTKSGARKTKPASMLYKAVLNGDPDGAVSLAKQLIDSGEQPLELINRVMIPAIEEVGRRYDKGEYFLPQLMMGADAMRAAFRLLKPLLATQDKEYKGKGKIVLATVKGDIHDIGKNIVSVLLQNNGFVVIDLGKDIPAEMILESLEREEPDILGLSALMTTTLPAMYQTISQVKQKKPDVMVMVGGAVVTESYAKRIGADGYGKNATEAVKVAKKLLKL